jgi:methanethiol S-methyltransferase
MLSDYLWLSIWWAAYCAIHSALISIRAKDIFQRLLGAGYRFYRLSYNLFSLIALVPLLLYSRSPRIQGPILFAWDGGWRILQGLLILAAAALIIGGARHYSIGQFLGIQQIRSKLNPGAMTESGVFDSSGVLGFVRHPWYTGVFFLLWAGDQNMASIVVHAVLSAYLVIGTLLEEQKLVFEFGDKYRKYQEEVSIFIPLKWMKRKLS